MGHEQICDSVFRFTLDRAVPVTTRLLASLLKAAAERAAETAQHGEMSVQKLVLSGKELAELEVPEKSVPELKKELKRYGVDFAVDQRKDGTTILYQAQNAKAFELAYESMMREQTKAMEREAKAPAPFLDAEYEEIKEKPTLGELLAAAKQKAAEKAATESTKTVEKVVEKAVEAAL